MTRPTPFLPCDHGREAVIPLILLARESSSISGGEGLGLQTEQSRFTNRLSTFKEDEDIRILEAMALEGGSSSR
jgi:hypothetical protein